MINLNECRLLAQGGRGAMSEFRNAHQNRHQLEGWCASASPYSLIAGACCAVHYQQQRGVDLGAARQHELEHQAADHTSPPTGIRSKRNVDGGQPAQRRSLRTDIAKKKSAARAGRSQSPHALRARESPEKRLTRSLSVLAVGLTTQQTPYLVRPDSHRVVQLPARSPLLPLASAAHGNEIMIVQTPNPRSI